MTEAGATTASLRTPGAAHLLAGPADRRGRHAAARPCGCTIRRPTSPSSSAPTRRPSARTRGRSARAASRTSPTRSRSRRSSPTSASARRRSPRPCCTTPSRTPTTRSTMLRADFGDEIAMLVDGVTKLDKLKYGDSAQAETVRKMVVAMSKDIRVLIIKLADRLHNARTWGFVPAESATRKAQETLEIYAPLAHRLGIQTIKWELEDLSFAVLLPEALRRDREPREAAHAAARGVRAAGHRRRQRRPQGRARSRARSSAGPKQYYSIYQKMIVRGREFDEIYDLVGIRVLVNSVRDCYAVLGAIHARWNPIPGRFKDYIATPKFNLYQSLHTTVIGPKGRAVEIQIRTHEMHQRAEFGVAAHWKYKERIDRPVGRRTPAPERHRHGLARAHHRLAGGDRRPGRVPRLPALRDRRERGLRLHAAGQGHRPAGGRDPGRLRLRGAHRGRPPHHGREGQRPAGAARERARPRRRGRGVHLEEPGRRARARTG